MFYSLKAMKGGQEKSPFSVSRDALVPFIAIYRDIIFFLFMKVEKHGIVHLTFCVRCHLGLKGGKFGVEAFLSLDWVGARNVFVTMKMLDLLLTL